MRLGIALALVVLSLARPVHAEPLRSLKLPTLVFAGAAAADWVSTYRFLTASPRYLEASPLVAFAHNKPVPTLAAGIAMDVASAWAIHRFVGTHHPKIAAAGLYLMGGIRGWTAYTNSR